jgi:hypothetical protein
MRIFGMLVYDECECHPLDSFGPFKRYKLDYTQEMALPLAGAIKINLARPHKGVVTFGGFAKAFGFIWIVTVAWTHARR